MKYAQDPKFKVPTMTELTSDLALRYLDTETEKHVGPTSQFMAHCHEMALARVLFAITGQLEWNTKAEAHRLEAQRLKSYFTALVARNEAASDTLKAVS